MNIVVNRCNVDENSIILDFKFLDFVFELREDFFVYNRILLPVLIGKGLNYTENEQCNIMAGAWGP